MLDDYMNYHSQSHYYTQLGLLVVAVVKVAMVQMMKHLHIHVDLQVNDHDQPVEAN
jgi:hypothetical protein